MAANAACKLYRQHAWKQDTCADCQRSKAEHAPVPSYVQPDKRPSTTGSSSTRNAVIPHPVSKTRRTVENQSDRVTSSPLDTPSIESRNKKHTGASEVHGFKPAPLKAKPKNIDTRSQSSAAVGVGAKISRGAVTSAQPDSSTIASVLLLPDDSTIAVSSGVALRNAKSSSKSQGVEILKVQGSVVPCESRLKDDSNRIPVAGDRESKRESLERNKQTEKNGNIDTEQQEFVIENTLICTEQLETTKIESNVKTIVQKGNSSPSHIYQVYDISAKGLSGTPAPLGPAVDAELDASVVRSGTLDRNSMTGSMIRSCRILDVAEEHVAMPYTVVDVTVSTLTRQSNKEREKQPPCLPSTPAPITSSTLPRTQSSTTNRSVAQNSSNELGSLQRVNNDNEAGNKTVEVVTSDLEDSEENWPKYMPKGIYEDICDDDYEKRPTVTRGSELTRNTSARLSLAKSSNFEAKLAALASLDLGKPAGGKVSSYAAPVPAKRDVRQEVIPLQELAEVVAVSSEVDKNVQPAAIARQDKARKSGGKSFFQKLLKIKTKDVGDVCSKSPPVVTPGNSSPVISAKSRDAEASPAQVTPPQSTCGNFLSYSPPVHASLQNESQQAVTSEVMDRISKRQQLTATPRHAVTASPRRDRTSFVDGNLVIAHNVANEQIVAQLRTTNKGSSSEAVGAMDQDESRSPIVSPRVVIASQVKPCPQSPRPSPLSSKPLKSRPTVESQTSKATEDAPTPLHNNFAYSLRGEGSKESECLGSTSCDRDKPLVVLIDLKQVGANDGIREQTVASRNSISRPSSAEQSLTDQKPGTLSRLCIFMFM